MKRHAAWLAALACLGGLACDEKGSTESKPSSTAVGLIAAPPPPRLEARGADQVAEPALRDAVAPAGGFDAGRSLFDGARADEAGGADAVLAGPGSGKPKVAYTGAARRPTLRIGDVPPPGGAEGLGADGSPGGEADGALGAEQGALDSEASLSAESPDAGELMADAVPARPVSGNTDQAKAYSVCLPRRSGATRETLLQVLPTWVEIGARGGAVYILGGYQAGRSCSANPKPDVARAYLTKQGFPGVADENLRSEFMDKIVGRVNAAGRLCGDCVSWPSALYRCAGHSGPSPESLRFKKSKAPEFLGSSTKSCSEAAAAGPGGPRLGDVYWFRKGTIGHMFMYTGGAGLPYEIVEMGPSGRSCKKVPGLPGAFGCVKAHASAAAFGWWTKPIDSCEAYRPLGVSK